LEPSPQPSESRAAHARSTGRTGRDLTSGPIGRTMMLFALPVMASNMLQSLSGSTNVAWVSHALGEAALTAASNANIILFLLLGAAFGASMSANLLIGQAIGSGDEALARKVVGTATVFFIVLSLTVGMTGFFLTPTILGLLHTPPDARAYAIAYLRVIFVAMPFMYFFNFLMMAQRATGDSRTPFFFSLAAVGMDMVLNPTLIMGLGPAPRLGIAGSALSTLTAQTLTLFSMLYYLHRKRSVLILRRSEWRLLRPDFKIIMILVTKGLPMAIQMVVVSGSAVMMISMVNSYGVHVAAAYGAASQLWTYVQMPAMAVGAAVSAMAAQSVGAGRMDRLGRIALLGSLYAMLMSAGPIVLIYLFEPIILRLFLPAGSPSIAVAMHINSVVLWAFVFFAVTFSISGIVRATGAVWPPLISMVVAMWVFRVPSAKLLQPYLGADAIWWSFPLGTIMSCGLLLAYYRWGRWRSGKLLDDMPRGDAVDTGMGPPSVAEETEAAADLADEVRRSNPSAPNRPRSEAPAG
jgi:putative MATE family efflux protein